MDKELYIVIDFNSEGTININKVHGTREEIQEYLMQIIEEDRERDADSWDMGTESINDLDYEGIANGVSGYNTFFEYSVNYMAFPFKDIVELDTKGRAEYDSSTVS